MEQLSTLRLELGINAQRFMQQVCVNNRTVEEQVEKGITLALEELSSKENFVLFIKDKTIEHISSIITEATFDWEFKKRIRAHIDKAIEEKIKEFSEKVAQTIIKGMNLQDIKIEP